ncbi:MAG: hypothetical protein ICV71_07250, partial [Thermoleophilia bacterium]|nr:hypothetical protein [Thermoleophilia bacterium]
FSWAIEPLSLAFRPVELAVITGAVAVPALVLWGGRSSRLRGFLLVSAYGAAAAAFFLAGER